MNDIKPICFSALGKYRPQLMGVAMTVVVHTIALCVEPLLLPKRGAEKPETK